MSPINFRPAQRDRSWILMGISGYTGTGKTFSALRVARGLAGDDPFAFIDTESNRALHYDWFAQPWHHARMDPPFTPERYLEYIKAAVEAGYKVVVVDSASHEYSGVGGLQDMAQAELERTGGGDRNTMKSWNAPKQRHRKFADELTRIDAHVILCFRAREAIEMRRNAEGKMEVVPVQSIPGHSGWLIDTEHKNRPLPYEMTLSMLLIPREAGKRGIPIVVKIEDQLTPFIPTDRPLSEETGEALRKWAEAKPELSPEVQALEEELLDLAGQMGKRDQIADTVAKHRAAYQNTHQRWLTTQVERARETVQQLDMATSVMSGDTP